MKVYTQEQGGRVIVIRLNRGDLLRESIEQVIKDEQIMDGTIVCGFGALETTALHLVKNYDVHPPKEVFPKYEQDPYELCSLQGVIADGVPHIHAVMSNDSRAIGGHLELGCIVSYLTEVVIIEHKNLKLTRKATEWGPMALEEKE